MNYPCSVIFEWDEIKSESCFQERGFDFLYVTAAFADPCRVTLQDLRFDYGEDRFQTTAKIRDRVFVVVYTLRQDSIRIISARKANAREVRKYENRS